MTVYTAVTQLSCLMSMIGAALVILTWAYPIVNRSKPGRILLFWLSVTDFLTSLFYFLQTFSWNRNTVICKTLGLLDILFPVASFIWTSFIAYYLYLAVFNQASKAPFNWKRLLLVFHVIVWSVSCATLLLVLLFGHAGRSADDNNDDQDSLTGGWCWVQGRNRQERFIWELIGGKLIEWITGLIIVPFLYTSVALRLYQIDQRQIKVPRNVLSDNTGRRSSQPAAAAAAEAATTSPMVHVTKLEAHRSNNNITSNNGSNSSRSEHSQPMELDEDEERSIQSTPFPPRLTSSGSEWSANQRQQRRSFEQDDDIETVNERTPSPHNSPDSNSSGTFFSQFYIKLTALPVVFIFIRCWSSFRVILDATGSSAAASPFLHGMQSFFDPSQGFFNAVLFVMFSREDRRRLGDLLHQLLSSCCLRYCGCLGLCVSRDHHSQETVTGQANAIHLGIVHTTSSNTLRDALIEQQREKSTNSLARPRENSTINIQDLEEDFECGEYDVNRLSNFSFDSRAVEGSSVF